MFYEDYAQREKLGLTEFTNCFYDRLSRVVVSSAYLEANEAFFENILWKCYDRYLHSKTEDFSINMIATLLEFYIDSMLRYKPDLELPEDTITLI